MTTQTVVTIVVIAVIVLLIAAAVAAAARSRRSRHLQEEFGPEYDRTVEGTGKRRDAERELAARRDEHAQLELRPLTPAARERYQSSWTQVQGRFVDAPVMALNEADSLVTQMMAERGYPTEDFDSQARLLSVQHGQVLDSYRSAHDVELASRRQQAGTEAIRNAMLDFRSVFEDLMADGDATAPRAGQAQPYPDDTLPTTPVEQRH